MVYRIYQMNEFTHVQLEAAMKRRMQAMLAESGHSVASSADEATGDFVTDDRLVLEIGGASKRPKQADFVIRGDIDQALGKALPLWALGFGY